MTDQQRSAALEAYCKTRSVELRNELVQEFLYLAQIVAKKYAGKAWSTTIFTRSPPWPSLARWKDMIAPRASSLPALRRPR